MRARLPVGLLVVALVGLVPAHAAPPHGPVGAGVPTPTLSEPPAGLRGFPLWDSYHDEDPRHLEVEVP